ncbi:hypothetical protein SAY86_023739 [Trapa natans]|uniref:K-box domain-containing protein n=1 Tax=Trapa natans TaxID=22666 RepID=A0AAN7LXU6_TRANT|nr:hypothetical protein SAY86_023739 [Trapa natans]
MDQHSVLEGQSRGTRKLAAAPQLRLLFLKLIPRHILGEAVGSLSFKELKNLEGRLEKAIGRVRSRKSEMLLAEIEYMEKREIELHNDNMYLRSKVAEAERAAATHQHQPPNLMQNGYDSIPVHSYDRNFLPVNPMETGNHHHEYSRTDQTALQLV